MYQLSSTHQNRSVLASLRAMTPHRAATFSEALRVAELQAAKLLKIWNIDEAHVPSEIVSELPRVRVVYTDLPVSGTSHWNGSCWVICLNRVESRNRQRFTLMHEFKHIVDHGYAHQLYSGDRNHTAQEQTELVADYFAGCVLVPRRLLKREWGHLVQRPGALARHFRVSVAAVVVRLAQTGLSVTTDRCARPISTSHDTYVPRVVRQRSQ